MAKGFLAGCVLFFFPMFLYGQAVAPVTTKRATFSAGGYFSFGGTDYGQNLGFSNRVHPDAYGPGAYADFNYLLWKNLAVGAEGEVRFLDFGTPAGIHEQNFLGGPRLIYNNGGRFRPYVKFLIGGSRFKYPSFITDQTYTYTTLVGGGGLDIYLNDRWILRPVDFEYQHWDFPPSGLTPWVYSVGVAYQFF